MGRLGVGEALLLWQRCCVQVNGAWSGVSGVLYWSGQRNYVVCGIGLL